MPAERTPGTALGTLALVAAWSALVALSCSRAPGRGPATAAAQFRSEFRRLIALLNGPPIDVTPSPAACAKTDVPPRYDGKPEDWYYGKGDCAATYVPDQRSLLTPLHVGRVQHLLKTAVYVEMHALLGRLGAQIGRASLSPLEKLEVQSTAWEMLFGLGRESEMRGDPAAAEELRVLSEDARELFRQTLLTDEQIVRLPKTADLAARIPGAESLPLLLRHDPDFIEISNRSGLHVSQTEGRFYMRILMTVSAEERARFRKYLLSASDIELVGFPWAGPVRAGPRAPHAPAMKAMQSMFGGVHAILLLFFNAVNTRMQMVPTGVIATFQEYRVDGRVRSHDLKVAARRLHCRTVNYVRSLGFEPGDRSPEYSVAGDDDLMALNDAFGVNPLTRVPVTTRKGACLDWHRSTATLNKMVPPAHLRLTAPFIDPPEEILRTGWIFGRVEQRLRGLLEEHG